MKFSLLPALFFLAISTSSFAEEHVEIADDAKVEAVNQPVAHTGVPATAVAGDPIRNPEQKSLLRYLLGAGLTLGGDKLHTLTYPGGDSSSVTAGGGMMLYGGLDYRLNDAVSIQGTAGYHFDSTRQSSDGEVKFDRKFLELLAYYHASEVFRLGVGLRSVVGPKLKGTGTSSATNTPFDNTVGMIIEGEFMIYPTIGIKVRHVSESYRPTGSSVTYKGNHNGLLANFYF